MASIGFKGESSFLQNPDAVEVIRRNQQLFFAGAGLVDVDSRKDAAVGELAVEHDFHIAGAFEFFKDDFVHAAAGVNQGRGDNGQAAALFDVAGRAEEPFRAMEGVGVQTSGEDLAAGRHHRCCRRGRGG